MIGKFSFLSYIKRGLQRTDVLAVKGGAESKTRMRLTPKGDIGPPSGVAEQLFLCSSNDLEDLFLSEVKIVVEGSCQVILCIEDAFSNCETSAMLQAMADDSVQPVPWVLVFFIFHDCTRKTFRHGIEGRRLSLQGGRL